jgi:selenoprotein W-related protein
VKHSVTIIYCTQCHWLPRAVWMAQELLHTFAEELEQVALKPATGGAFQIELDGQTVWERKNDGGFPDAAELKRRIRDRIDPGRDLGHIDAAKA